MIISKRVHSPEFAIPKNTVDRTPGFYGHLPKFWNCRKYDWTYNGVKPFDDDDFIAHMNSVYAKEKALHAGCVLPWHMSYSGYLVYVLPRRGRLMWHYLGKPPSGRRFVWQKNYSRKFKSIW